MKKHLTLTAYADAHGLRIETVVGMVRAGELLVTMVRGRQHVPVDRENRTGATERRRHSNNPATGVYRANERRKRNKINVGTETGGLFSR